MTINKGINLAQPSSMVTEWFGLQGSPLSSCLTDNREPRALGNGGYVTQTTFEDKTNKYFPLSPRSLLNMQKPLS